MKRNEILLKIEDDNPKKVQISISGYLDLFTITALWQKCIDLQQQRTPEILIVDTQNLYYCDGAGVSLLLELKKRQAQINKKFQIINLSVQLQRLLNLVNEDEIKEPLQKESSSFIVHMGQTTIKIRRYIQENITFIGLLSCQLFQSLSHPKSIRWRDFLKAVEDVGPKALFLVILIGFLVGLITAFQAAIPLEKFGAQIYIIDLVGIGLLKEMGPLMAAILLAGRTASAFAAELGTMKINQEIDALTTMGLEPVKFLAVPRILATTIMTPFLNIFLILFGLIGCGVVMSSLGYNFHIYITHLQSAVHLRDFIEGMIKTFVFGIAIGCIGCLHGLKTRLNSEAVGHSTTNAVVSSIIMIVVIDGIFACVYYALGI